MGAGRGWQGGGQSGPGGGGKRRGRLAPDVDPPPGSHRDGQPPARRPRGVRHAGRWPRPAAPVGPGKARFHPGAPTIPPEVADGGRQLGYDPPGVLIARFPPGQAGPAEPARAALEGDAGTSPLAPRLGAPRLEREPAPLTGRVKGPAGRNAQNRRPSPPGQPPTPPAGRPPAGGQHDPGPGGGPARDPGRRLRHPSGRPAVSTAAVKTVPASGRAPPR